LQDALKDFRLGRIFREKLEEAIAFSHLLPSGSSIPRVW
jgi:hypothetical protein